jgi:hypothetical protein
VASAMVAALGLPFLILARRERASSDPIVPGEPIPEAGEPRVPVEADHLSHRT